MLIQTSEGKRRVDDALLLCVDKHPTWGQHAYVTVYLVTGEQVTGIVEQVEPVDQLAELRLVA